MPPQPSEPHDRPAQVAVQHEPLRQSWPAVQHAVPQGVPAQAHAPAPLQV